MSRLPYLAYTEFNDDQLTMFEHITAGDRGASRPKEEFLNTAGGLSGPFHPWVYAPRLGDACQALGAAVRFRTTLEPRLRELAILTVAVDWKARYEWWAHARIARADGLDDSIIQSLERGERPAFGEDEAGDLVYRFSTQLVATRRVEDDTYQQAIDHFGTQAVVELVATIGYYTLVSMTLNAFDVPIPEGEAEPFQTK